MALLIAVKNTTAAGRPSMILVGLLNTGPNPSALPTAQPNKAKPKIGMRTILVMNRYRSLCMLIESARVRHRSDSRDVEERQLNQIEDEEAKQLSRGDVCAGRQVVREMGERGPNRLKHDLDALSTLIRLRTGPDNRGHGSANQGNVYAALTKGRAREDREVYTVHASDPSIGGVGTGDQDCLSAKVVGSNKAELAVAEKDSSDGRSR